MTVSEEGENDHVLYCYSSVPVNTKYHSIKALSWLNLVRKYKKSAKTPNKKSEKFAKKT